MLIIFVGQPDPRTVHIARNITEKNIRKFGVNIWITDSNLQNLLFDNKKISPLIKKYEKESKEILLYRLNREFEERKHQQKNKQRKRKLKIENTSTTNQEEGKEGEGEEAEQEQEQESEEEEEEENHNNEQQQQGEEEEIINLKKKKKRSTINH